MKLEDLTRVSKRFRCQPGLQAGNTQPTCVPGLQQHKDQSSLICCDQAAKGNGPATPIQAGQVGLLVESGVEQGLPGIPAAAGWLGSAWQQPRPAH